MRRESTPIISGAVEGTVDEAVIRRLIHDAGATPGPIYGRMGKGPLLKRLAGYNAAARFQPWIVLLDMDSDYSCAPPARREWLPDPAEHMCFRIAVREVETWLLADVERMARFLAVSRAIVPSRPDEDADPKARIVWLAGRSRSRPIRVDMVPGQHIPVIHNLKNRDYFQIS